MEVALLAENTHTQLFLLLLLPAVRPSVSQSVYSFALCFIRRPTDLRKVKLWGNTRRRIQKLQKLCWKKATRRFKLLAERQLLNSIALMLKGSNGSGFLAKISSPDINTHWYFLLHHSKKNCSVSIKSLVAARGLTYDLTWSQGPGPSSMTWARICFFIGNSNSITWK